MYIYIHSYNTVTYMYVLHKSKRKTQLHKSSMQAN